MVEQTAPKNEAHHPNCFQNREAPIPDDLPDDLCDCRILWMLAVSGARERADSAEAELAKVKRGAKELGRILHRTLTDALDASGRHDAIDEDGDGDWGVVWETLAELRPRAEAAEAIVRRVEGLADRLDARFLHEDADAIRRALAPPPEVPSRCLGVRIDGPMSAMICDEDGWVRSGTFHWGTDYKCTGSVHPPLDSRSWPGREIRCANPIHNVTETAGVWFPATLAGPTPDDSPCPNCGGDRLRPNFTGDNGLCHVGGRPYGTPPSDGNL